MSSSNRYPINRKVVLAARPGRDSQPKEEHFRTEECQFPSEDLSDSQVLIKTLYLSVDPAMRCRMNDDTGVSYLQPWKVGECIEGLGGIGIVVKSQSQHLADGDIVTMGINWPWQLYFITYDSLLQKVDKSDVGERISLVLSCLGMIGLTALLGIREKGHIQPGKGQTIVLSGAAGACGHLAGQIAKLEGCKRVVGLCGTDEKCHVLTKELGFDDAVNYKTENIEERLKEACPDGIQVYFDNVGGEISNAVIKQMSFGSHIILCGQISQYNKDVPYPPPISSDLKQLLETKKITRQRFLVLNYPEKYEETLSQLTLWVKEEKLKVKETIEEGLENTGVAFIKMMNGGNIGKQLVHVKED